MAQVDRIFKLRSVQARTTFGNMNTLLPVPMEKPRRFKRPELERFFAEFVQRQNSLAIMFWEYINFNDKRLDEIQEQIKKLRG